MQTEGRKLIFIMNFSVLDFFKFASRMPQIAQILVLTFKLSMQDGIIAHRKTHRSCSGPSIVSLSSWAALETELLFI